MLSAKPAAPLGPMPGLAPARLQKQRGRKLQIWVTGGGDNPAAPRLQHPDPNPIPNPNPNPNPIPFPSPPAPCPPRSPHPRPASHFPAAPRTMRGVSAEPPSPLPAAPSPTCGQQRGQGEEAQRAAGGGHVAAGLRLCRPASGAGPRRARLGLRLGAEGASGPCCVSPTPPLPEVF